MPGALRAILSRIRGSFSRRRLDEDFSGEVQVHLAMLAERFVRQGMSPEEASNAAKRQFGGVTQMKEELRERRALPHIDILLQDIKYAFREVRKAPAFTASAALTLALGIGASTAVFAVVYAVLLNPLPYPEPDQLVSFRSLDTRGTPHSTSLSYPNFFDFRAKTQVFEHLVSYRDAQFTLTDSAPATQVSGEIVSWDLFPLLRVRPQLGRGFFPEEESPGRHVVVLSRELWQSRFGGDDRIVGRAVSINSKLFTVAGIAPSGFRFPAQNSAVQLWTTLSEDATVSEFHPLTVQRGARVMDAIARLKPGVAIEQAQAQMDSIAGVLAKQYPDTNKNIATTYIRPELDRLVGNTRKPILILLGAVGLLLLIACANVANLLLARSAERGREFALRAALGASRPTVIRQLLVESLVLGLLGSALGVLFGFVSLRLILPFAGDSIPRVSQAGLDSRVLAFSVGLALFTSVLFSLAPVIQIAKLDLAGSLKEGSRNINRGHDRLRATLVVAQITLGLVLLSGAELLIASFLHLERRDPGFRPDHLLTFNISLPETQYKVARQIAFSDRLLDRLRSLPGVRTAATGMPLPLTGHQMSVSFDIEERPAAPPDRPHADIAIVTPGYFATMGIPVLKGRDFTERDVAKTPRVVVVNQAFGDKYFPGANVIGKRIEPGATNGDSRTTMCEIIGVVGNAKQSALSPEPDPIYYFPYKQLSWGVGTVILRTSVPPLTMESAARAAVASVDKQVPMYEVRTMEHLTSTAIARPRFQMLLMSSFAAIALLLAVVGLYGVLAYSVTRRRREIGVRIALGAGRADVLGLVIGQAMLLVLTGLVLGLAGAVAGGRLLQTMIYGISPGDPLLLSVACATLTITSVIAAYMPATRAASVDPMEALRSE